MSATTRIFIARTVHTLDSGVSPARSAGRSPLNSNGGRSTPISRPSAQPPNAVAVRDGRVLGVGEVDDLVQQFSTAEVDDRFRDSVVLPGFVEAHSHRLTGGLWAFTYVGFFERTDHTGRAWPGCRSIDDVVARLAEVDKILPNGSPLIAWGLDPIYFAGERLVARHLDAASSTRPIFVLHASAHLATVNTYLMRQYGIDRTGAVDGVPLDESGEPIGELQEFPAMSLAGDIGLQIISAAAAPEAMQRFGQIARLAGVTTLTDLGTTPLDDDATVSDLVSVVESDGFPARLSVFFNPGMSRLSGDSLRDRFVNIQTRQTPKLRFGGIKLILDGSIQGFTARLSEPGYLGDRPNGMWLIAPEQVYEWVARFHEAGFIIHAHCNGDEAGEVFIDAVAKALAAHPNSDHRHTMQHSQLTTAAQYERMGQLQIAANLFSNHTYFWGDQHRDITVGFERSHAMNAAATALKHGVPLSIHSDSPITPLGPLHVAWCAVNRISATGQTMGTAECISVDQAMTAITMGAARQLGMDAEIGSLTPGKFADLVALADDPFEVPPMELRDIEVVGTVLSGVPTA